MKKLYNSLIAKTKLGRMKQRDQFNECAKLLNKSRDNLNEAVEKFGTAKVLQVLASRITLDSHDFNDFYRKEAAKVPKLDIRTCNQCQWRPYFVEGAFADILKIWKTLYGGETN